MRVADDSGEVDTDCPGMQKNLASASCVFIPLFTCVRTPLRCCLCVPQSLMTERTFAVLASFALFFANRGATNRGFGCPSRPSLVLPANVVVASPGNLSCPLRVPWLLRTTSRLKYCCLETNNYPTYSCHFRNLRIV